MTKAVLDRPRHERRARHQGARGLRLVVALAALAALVAGCAWFPPRGPAARGPAAPLTSTGRWFTDADGRVVLLHGVNQVAKAAPYYPSAFGFGDDDAAFLAAHGFNAVRLGVVFGGLMPEPGRVDHAYIEALASTVKLLRKHGIFVLLDFHQDGFSPKYNGNGFPDWMAYDDGLPNPPDAVFPLYYVQNPAMQRAFESFWANRAGPGGIGLQDYFAQGLEAVVDRFDRDPNVIGYEPINEPWPGADWAPCLTGCPDQEAQHLAPFYAKVTAVVRRHTRTQQVFVEPFTLFNFGTAPTSLPGAATGDSLSTHSYANSPTDEKGLVDQTVAAATRDQATVLLTEFGATDDGPTIRRLVKGFDDQLVPWLFWSYDENIIRDRAQPASLANLRSRAGFEALVEPYPTAIAGVPTAMAFDPVTKHFELTFDTDGPDAGARHRPRPTADTVVFMPRLHYPTGYSVHAVGATVVSRRDADHLVLRTRRGADRVSLTVVPRD